MKKINMRKWLKMAERKRFYFGFIYINHYMLTLIIRKGPFVSRKMWKPIKEELKKDQFKFNWSYGGWYVTISSPKWVRTFFKS